MRRVLVLWGFLCLGMPGESSVVHLDVSAVNLPSHATFHDSPARLVGSVEPLQSLETTCHTGEGRTTCLPRPETVHPGTVVESSPPLVPFADPFPRPPGLQAAVAFWREVFGRWRRDQMVLHDRIHLGIVYELVEMPDAPGGHLTRDQQVVPTQRQRYIERNLQDLEYRVQRRLPISGEQQRLLDVITRNAGPRALVGASKRVRMQRGMRESFRRSVDASGRYEGMLREVFQEAGLPADLAYLPHVESAFGARVRSHAGAVGLWQFVSSTGRRFLQINDAVDERYDPILATHGAARYFAFAHGLLQDWGLTITSYNHGLAGMMRAKEQYGPDIARVIGEYQSEAFGFASRNFYAEFLAVRDLMNDLPAYFPEGTPKQPPLEQRRARLPYAMPVARVASYHGVPAKALISLNPAWRQSTVRGRVRLPADLAIWLPGRPTPATSPQLVQASAAPTSTRALAPVPLEKTPVTLAQPHYVPRPERLASVAPALVLPNACLVETRGEESMQLALSAW